MIKGLKWFGIFLAGLLVVTALGLGVLLLFFDWNWFKDTIVARASEATGRAVIIEGDIDGELALVPHIKMSGVRVANADWAKDTAKHIASVKALDFRIELLELLRGRVVLPELNIDGAKIFLEKRKDGTPNWEFGPSVAGAVAEAAVPDEGSEFPIVGNLTIDNSELNYRDPVNDIEIAIKFSDLDAEGGRKQAVRATGNGRYKKEKFELAVTGGQLLDLRKEDKPYPINFKLSIGNTTFDGRGSALEPLHLEGLDLDLKLAGPDLADLFPIVGIPLPPSGQYRLSGHLTRNRNIWSFKGFDGRVGNSDLQGDLTLDFAEKVPFMKANLTSKRLDFDDLGGFIGAPPNQKRLTQAGDRILPDMKLKLDRLRSMNMRVVFKGNQIIAPKMPLNDLNAELRLQDGKLTIDPLKFSVAGGSIAGPLVLDGREKVPQVRADLTVRGLGIKPFLDQIEMGDLSKGRFGGKIKLAGRGDSFAEVLGTADGRVSIAMVGGTINPLLVELIGLDIAQALAIVILKGKPVPIRCVVGDMSAKNGVLGITGMVIDTTDSNIWVRGDIDLRHENLKLRVRADPKDASLLSANAPVAISGTFKDPSIAIDTLDTEDEGGLTKAIGKIVNPILALLPFVDLGLGEDTDCRNSGAASKKSAERRSPAEANKP